MKKTILTAAIALTFCAATTTQAQVKLGLKGGVNVTSMSISGDVFDTDNNAGFFVGPTMKVSLPLGGLGFDISALYDQRSADLKYDGVEGTEKMKTQSIDIPINIRYSMGPGSLVGFYLFAGPQFGFNIGDKEQTIIEDVADWNLKSSTFSVNVGLGLLLVNHLQLSANYNIACGKTGEVSVWNAAKEGYSSIKTGRTNAWQIGLAYYF